MRLDEMMIDGIKTNIDLHADLVRDEEFKKAALISIIWRKNSDYNELKPWGINYISECLLWFQVSGYS
jgi:acetyl/propionyl-CoA carboxylase alpha subunit